MLSQAFELITASFGESYYNDIAQVFTAGQTGLLTGYDFGSAGNNTNAGTIIFTLYTGSDFSGIVISSELVNYPSGFGASLIHLIPEVRHIRPAEPARAPAVMEKYKKHSEQAARSNR